MDMQLRLDGADATEQTTLALQDWIKQERIEGLRVQRESGPPKAGEMGLDPISVLTIVLGSKAAVELIKSLHAWIKVRRPKVKIKLKVGHSELEIDAENIPDQNELISNLLAAMKGAGGG